MLSVLEAAAVVLITALLLVGHVVMSARVWRENTRPIGLLKLAGLSVLTYIVWYIAAVVAALILGFYSPASRGVEVDVYYATLGALIYPCDALPLLNGATGGIACDLPGYAVGVPVLFVLGLLGAVALNYRQRSQPANPGA